MDRMIIDTPFNKAQVAFKVLLQKQRLPEDLLWLFREDVISERGEYLIRVPTPTRNEKLAEQCYESGRNRGFGVGLHGFCLLDNRVCCYIQLPEDDLDSQHKLMSDIYVKYSVIEPIRKGKAVKNPIQWSIRKWQNSRKQQGSLIDDIPMKKTLMPI